jgi:sugar phosphate isomerase/epimerase
LNDSGKPVSFQEHAGQESPDVMGTQLRYSISQLTTLRSSFGEDVGQAVDAGVPAIGVWRRKLDDYGEQQAAERIAAAELAVSSVSYVGGFTGSAGMTYREAMTDAYSTLFTAAALRAECLVVCPGSRGRYTARHERRLVAHAVRELAIAAEEFDLTLALQPMQHQFAHRWTSLNTLDSTLEMLDEVDRPNVGLVLDTFHLGHDRELVDRIPDFTERVAIVQLCDAPAHPESLYDRCLLGEGVLPLREIVNTLLDNDYRGCFDLQIWSETLWDQSADVAIRKTRESMQQLCSTLPESTSQTVVG